MPTLQWLDRADAIKAAEAVPFHVLDFDQKLSDGDPAGDKLRQTAAELRAKTNFGS